MRTKARKLMWSVPLVATLAIIGALAAFMALAPGSLLANELPNNPQNLKVDPAAGNEGRTTLVLTWEAPASGAPDMYRIDVSTDNDKYKFLTDVSGATLTYKHVVRPRGMDRDAPDGKERFYRVYAKNSHGYGAVSTAESDTTKALSETGEVGSVRVAGKSPTEIELTWAAPDDGGSDIMGYCIRAWPAITTGTVTVVSDSNCKDSFMSDGPGGNAGDYRSSTGVNDQVGGVIRIEPGTSYTHKKLRAEQEWTYQVYAFNRHGNSATTSGEFSAKAKAADRPTAPGNLLALQEDDDADVIVNLYWTAPDDGGQDISGYRIEVSNKANYWPSSGFIPIDALGSAVKVSAQVLVADTNDPATPAAMVAIITLDADSQTAVEPYQIKHTLGDTGSVNLFYRVRTMTGTGASEMMSTYSSTPIEVTDPAGADDFTEPIEAPGLAADGAVPQDVGGDDDSPGDDDRTPGQINLTVTRTTAGANSYRVDVSDDDGATWDIVETATRPIDGSTYEHEGLKPGASRHFRLFAKKGSDYGLSSIVVEDSAGNSKAPSKVLELGAVKDGAGKINLSWKAPDSTGGAEVEKYCIVVNQIDNADVHLGTLVTRATIETRQGLPTRPTNCTRLGESNLMPISVTGQNHVFQVPVDTTMATFTGLAQKTRWRFEVYALNNASDEDVDDDGTADADGLHGVAMTSDKVSAKTDAASKPGAPQNLTAQLAKDTNEVTGIGMQGVLLLWNPPADPAGAKVTTYKIERSVDDGTFDTQVDGHSSAVTHWVDKSEPAADEERMYRITALNAVGPGTEMATVMIPLADHTTHTPDVPDTSTLTKPTDVTATSNAAGMVTVSWTDGENAPGGHLVLLFTGDFTEVPGIEVPADGTNTQSFTNIAAGEYVAVVVSIKSRSEYLYDYSLVTVN